MTSLCDIGSQVNTGPVVPWQWQGKPATAGPHHPKHRQWLSYLPPLNHCNTHQHTYLQRGPVYMHIFGITEDWAVHLLGQVKLWTAMKAEFHSQDKGGCHQSHRWIRVQEYLHPQQTLHTPHHHMHQDPRPHCFPPAQSKHMNHYESNIVQRHATQD